MTWCVNSSQSFTSTWTAKAEISQKAFIGRKNMGHRNHKFYGGEGHSFSQGKISSPGLTLKHAPRLSRMTPQVHNHWIEASRLHLGCQCQHSAVICSGALLFSSRVPCPSLVTLCSHKSGRCAVELYHASHLWYPAFYTSPMASSALQH